MSRGSHLTSAGTTTNAYRIVWGLFFLGAAAFNAAVTIPSARSVLRAFADLSWPGAEALVRGVLLPHAAAVIGLVVVFEVVVGAMLLSRSIAATVGLWLATGWLLTLAPFLGVYAGVNVVLAVSMLPLMSRRYDRSLRDMLGGSRHPERLRWTLIALTLFVAANALYGGIGLVGSGLGMPLSWLEGTWFDSWVIPGILLLAIVALPMLAAAWAMWRRWPRASEVTIGAGALLAGWIVGQMSMVRYFFLQPVLLLLGVAIAGLAFMAFTGKRKAPRAARRMARPPVAAA